MQLEIERKTFENLIKNHNKYASYYYDNVLRGLCVKAEDGILKFASTDANRMLISEIKLNEKINFKPVIYDLAYLSSIKFIKNYKLKGYNLNLQIKFTKKEMIIIDPIYQTTFKVPIIVGQYPQFEQLIPNTNDEKFTKIGLRKKYISDLNLMLNNERSDIIVLNVNNKEKNASVIFKTVNEDETIKQTSLIMPIVLD